MESPVSEGWSEACRVEGGECWSRVPSSSFCFLCAHIVANAVHVIMLSRPPLPRLPRPSASLLCFLAFLASLVGPGGSQPFQVALSALLQKATYTVLLARPDGPCASDDTARTRTTTSFATCPPLHAVCHSHTLLPLAHPRPNEGFQRLALL